MEEMHINWVAILVAVVANVILGFIWYTPLFGKAWAKELGFDTTVKPASGELAKGMIFMVIGNFLMAYVFANNMAAWSYVPGNKEMSPMASRFRVCCMGKEILETVWYQHRLPFYDVIGNSIGSYVYVRSIPLC
jgi:hypothetical protein